MEKTMDEAALKITNIRPQAFLQGSILAGLAAILGGQTALAATAAATSECPACD
jgi:hypothetical protein